MCRHDSGIDVGRLQSFVLARDRVALACVGIPARIVDNAEPPAVLGETQIGVVLAQLQSIFGARREHPIRL